MPQWRKNLYILFVTQMLSTAGFSLIFPFLPLYVRELGIASFGTLEFWSGMVFSAQALTMMISAPLWGVVADRYGRKPMMVRATLGGAVIIAAMGFVSSAEQLTLLRAIQGLITGTIAAANALVAATAPKERSGEAMGLLQTGTWVGIAIGPLLGGLLGDAFGFRASFWITGTLLGLAGLAVIIGVREEFTPKPKREMPGLFSSFRQLTMPGMGTLYSVSLLSNLSRSVILPIAPLFVVQLMHSEANVGTITGIMMGATAFVGSASAVWFGRLGDRLGHGRILFTGAVLGVIFYLPQPFVTTAWQLVLLQALTGLATGAILPTTGALLNLYTPAGSQGATYGLDNSVKAAGRMIAPMLAAGVAVWFGLRGVFALAAVVYIITAVVGLVIWRGSFRPSTTEAQAVVSGD